MRNQANIRRILSTARPYLKSMVLATLFLLLASLISLALPWIIRKQVDRTLIQSEAPSLLLLAGLIFLFLVQAAFSFGHNYLMGAVGQRVLAQLRMDLFSHLQSLSLPFFSRRRSGELLSRLTNDLGVVQTLATELPVNLIRQVVILTGGIGIIIYMNWRLALLTLLLIPVVVTAARWMGKRLKKLSRSVQDEMADTTVLMEEMISGIRTIKSFGREEHERRRFAIQTEKTLQVVLKRLRISAAFGPMMIFFGTSAATGLLWYGAREVIDKQTTPGEMIAFVIYAVIIRPVRKPGAALFAASGEPRGRTAGL